mmetsp:Transcript_54148/g.132378  ORF Transcript_54148/g.132378 Transcript_54148/m.132378 type:complete len:222 (+) Transcript_54148:209-874(+)
MTLLTLLNIYMPNDGGRPSADRGREEVGNKALAIYSDLPVGVRDEDELLAELLDVVLDLLELGLVLLLAELLGGRVERERQRLVLLVDLLPVVLEPLEERIPLSLGDHLDVVLILRVVGHLHLLNHPVLLLDLVPHAVQVLRRLPVVGLLEVVDLVGHGLLGHGQDVVHCVGCHVILLRHQPHHRPVRARRHRRLHMLRVTPRDPDGRGVADRRHVGLPPL